MMHRHTSFLVILHPSSIGHRYALEKQHLPQHLHDQEDNRIFSIFDKNFNSNSSNSTIFIKSSSPSTSNFSNSNFSNSFSSEPTSPSSANHRHSISTIANLSDCNQLMTFGLPKCLSLVQVVLLFQFVHIVSFGTLIRPLRINQCWEDSSGCLSLGEILRNTSPLNQNLYPQNHQDLWISNGITNSRLCNLAKISRKINNCFHQLGKFTTLYSFSTTPTPLIFKQIPSQQQRQQQQ
ncbi:hypothetical protein ACTA71_011810 [Dictyostelium dimigraforme]